RGRPRVRHACAAPMKRIKLAAPPSEAPRRPRRASTLPRTSNMQFSISAQTGRLATILGFLSSVALGCVITVGDGGKQSSECPDANSYLSGNKCFCDIGYDWCKPGDDSDLT